MENAEAILRAHSESERPAPSEDSDTPPWVVESAIFRGYRVNVLVTHDAGTGAPVVFEEPAVSGNYVRFRLSPDVSIGSPTVSSRICVRSSTTCVRPLPKRRVPARWRPASSNVPIGSSRISAPASKAF